MIGNLVLGACLANDNLAREGRRRKPPRALQVERFGARLLLPPAAAEQRFVLEEVGVRQEVRTSFPESMENTNFCGREVQKTPNALYNVACARSLRVQLRRRALHLGRAPARALPGRSHALRVPHSKSLFVWHVCVGAQGA